MSHLYTVELKCITLRAAGVLICTNSHHLLCTQWNVFTLSCSPGARFSKLVCQTWAKDFSKFDLIKTLKTLQAALGKHRKYLRNTCEELRKISGIFMLWNNMHINWRLNQSCGYWLPNFYKLVYCSGDQKSEQLVKSVALQTAAVYVLCLWVTVCGSVAVTLFPRLRSGRIVDGDWVTLDYIIAAWRIIAW